MKLFVWDFHGVLEKDNELAVLDISNQVLAETGYVERFTKKDNQKFYGLKWFQYFERLLPDQSLEQHMALQAACFAFAERNMHILAKHIKPNKYANTVLNTIQKKGHDQIVISNTRPQDLVWFLEAVGISKYFPAGKAFGVNAHQKHGVKKDVLAQYLHAKIFDGVVIIGDSHSDMELCQISGGTTYFYNHPHIGNTGPVDADYKITDLRKILNEV